jgi:hypothetical protein
MDKQLADELNKPQRTSLGNFISCIILDFLCNLKRRRDGEKVGRTLLVTDREKYISCLQANPQLTVVQV